MKQIRKNLQAYGWIIESVYFTNTQMLPSHRVQMVVAIQFVKSEFQNFKYPCSMLHYD